MTDDVDGRLDPPVRADTEQHLAACAACARLRSEQRDVKDLLRARRGRGGAPAEVRARVLAALDGEPRARRPSNRRRWLLVGAIAALALFALMRGRHPEPDLVLSMVRDVQVARAGEIHIGMHTEDPGELRHYFRSHGVAFEQTVPDLRPLGLRQIGGTVEEVDGLATAVTIFEGPFGRVVCRRFPAGSIRLPEGGRKVGDATVYTRNGVTMRIVRDGDAICILAAAMPEDAFVRALVSMS